MRFESRSGDVLTSVEDWGRLAGPAAARHWKPERSAYELARDWLEGGAPERVTALLEQAPALAPVTLELGVAEKKSQFDAIRSGPRNHDLLVTGVAASAPVVIGVEGKADEPFDLPLAAWLEARMRSTPASRAGERLDGLTRHFFGTTLREEPSLGGLGYQLLSTLAGTLADARAHAAAHAVVLIHEFVTPATRDDKHGVNGAALTAFMDRLADGRRLERTGDDDAWIAGPLAVSGDGRYLPRTLPVYLSKLVTRRR